MSQKEGEEGGRSDGAEKSSKGNKLKDPFI